MTSKTIVAGVDGSDTAAAGAQRAAVLADGLGGHLHLVCAFNKFEAETVTMGSEAVLLSTEDDAANLASNAADDLRSAFPDLEMSASAFEGKPADALIETAERLDASVIVVGNKRVQSIAGRVLGSIAQQVAQHAPCDVYIAHTHSH